MDAKAYQGLDVDFLSAIIEHVAHPIFVKDRNFEFVLLNKALCQMVGHEREEMLGRTDYDFFPVGQADFFRQKDKEMFATGATVTVEEEQLTDSDGTLHILETVKVPYCPAGDQVTHLVGIISDITQIKLAEETLRNAKTELERAVAERTAELRKTQQALLRKERLAVMGELAGGLAHQLRNPLGAMQNALALLGKGPLSESQQRAGQVLQEEMRRANAIVTGLLDYARVRPPTRVDLSLRELLEDCLRYESVPTRVDVRIHVASDVMVWADSMQLQQVVANLIRNALEAMAGTTGEMVIAATSHEQVVRLTISDSGPGVAREHQATLFQPLVTSKTKGLGLGLSTARRLMEAQGGRLELLPDELSACGGATFFVEVPKAPK